MDPPPTPPLSSLASCSRRRVSNLSGAPITGVCPGPSRRHARRGRRRRREAAARRSGGSLAGDAGVTAGRFTLSISLMGARVGFTRSQVTDTLARRRPPAVRAGAVRAEHLVLLLAGGRRRDVSVVLRRREVAFGRQPARGGGVTGSTGQRGVARAARRGFGLLARFWSRRNVGWAGGETSRSVAVAGGAAALRDADGMVSPDRHRRHGRQRRRWCVPGSRGRGGFKKFDLVSVGTIT